MARKEHDVLIVGSGHSGGIAANILTQKGISCPMLDAGPEMDYERDRTTKAVHELPYRGFNKPGRLPHVIQANEFNANQWVDEQEVPYTHNADTQYNWVRVRLVGGRSHFWARQSFRLSDYEFKAAEIDGGGDNWPISLADLAPYYSRVEDIFKVSGRKEGWPQFPDGNFVESTFSPDSETIKRFTEVANQRGIGVSKMRSSRGQNGLASSINLLLPDALATGKLDIVSNAIVRQLGVDKNTGLLNGAHFVERHSRREMQVKAKVVVLAAGSLESTRLLLNSGIANSSGVMGHYLMDQIYGVSVVASVAEARDGKARPGLMGGSAFVPRFRNLKKTEKNNFIKGYCLNIGSGGGGAEARDGKARPGLMGGSAFVPRFRNLKKTEKNNFIKGYCLNIGSGGGAAPRFFAAYGEELEKKLESYAGSCVTGSIYGERVARFENHVRINKDVVDRKSVG